MKTTELSLELFNAVVAKGDGSIILDTVHGIVIDGRAAYAKAEIQSFLKQKKLSGQELNKTFHKSWEKIKESSRVELLVEQIRHYLSTYGTFFEGGAYIPDEKLEIPDLKLKFKVIRAISKEEMVQKCLNMLGSGLALKQETLEMVFDLLDGLQYKFTGEEEVRNKEAVVLMVDRYNFYPKNAVDFLRYLIYKSTGKTLLIKDSATVTFIKGSDFDPSSHIRKYGLEKLAPIFNRYKPLFLAYKKFCGTEINKISKLSKSLHEPFVQSDLNLVTVQCIQDKKSLGKATMFALFKALNACYSRFHGQDSFNYVVRNGKSFAKRKERSNMDVCRLNYKEILLEIIRRLPSQRSVYIPDNITYALPTSEKMFVGNIPTGTKIEAKTLNVGVYWEDSWGARDLDLSSIDENGVKVGWNANYRKGDVYYSGDMTSAPKGAVEFLRFERPPVNQVVYFNCYYGDENAKYKIVIGEGSKVDRDFMMNPNKVLFEQKCEMPQKQTNIGLVQSKGDKSVFTFLNFGSGTCNVSGYDKNARIRMEALFQQWDNSVSLNELLGIAGWKFVDKPEDADLDLSFDKLDKDTFIGLFK